MRNVQLTTDGDILIIKVDLSKRFEKSKSGKSVGIASTAGNVQLESHPNIRVGLNVYIKEEA